MSVLDKLRKNTTVKETALIADSKFFQDKDNTPMPVPALNLAFSGKLTEGFSSGLTIWAGPSKHFKTAFSLLTAKSYLDKYKDSVVLFYDSEFGTPQGYFDAFGIDTSRVLHTPIADIEQLKFDLMAQLENLARGDRVIIVVDSVGNLASKKEVEDALNQKSVADMTRAKQLKSFFRMVTPHLTIKNIPMMVVNHIYMTQEMFSKPVVSGGTGLYYSADNIFIIGRRQDKEGDELMGYEFVINVEKSRYIKEKSKIPITVRFDGGISPWSGLMEIAMELGFVVKPKNGWYAKVDRSTGEVVGKNYRLADTNNAEFWLPIMKDKSFQDAVEGMFRLGTGEMMEREEGDSLVDQILMED